MTARLTILSKRSPTCWRLSSYIFELTNLHIIYNKYTYNNFFFERSSSTNNRPVATVVTLGAK